jgi:hypothetical protein
MIRVGEEKDKILTSRLASRSHVYYAVILNVFWVSLFTAVYYITPKSTATLLKRSEIHLPNTGRPSSSRSNER